LWLLFTRAGLFRTAVLLRRLNAFGSLRRLRALRFLALLGKFCLLLLLSPLSAFHTLLLDLLSLLDPLAAFHALGCLRLVRLPLGTVGLLDIRSRRPLLPFLISPRTLLLFQLRFPRFHGAAALFVVLVLLFPRLFGGVWVRLR
jgi:hypothetical protein